MVETDYGILSVHGQTGFADKIRMRYDLQGAGGWELNQPAAVRWCIVSTWFWDPVIPACAGMTINCRV
jgi:hypothetical protein